MRVDLTGIPAKHQQQQQQHTDQEQFRMGQYQIDANEETWTLFAIILSCLGIGIAFLVGFLLLVKRCLAKSQTATAMPSQDSNASLLNSSQSSSPPKLSDPEENRRGISGNQSQSTEKIIAVDNQEESLRLSDSTEHLICNLGIPIRVASSSLDKETEDSGVAEASVASRQYSLEDEFMMDEANSSIAWLNNETDNSELDLSSIIKEALTESISDVMKKFEVIEEELFRVSADADDMMHCINNAKRSEKITQIISRPLYPSSYYLTDVSPSKDVLELPESALKENDRWGSVPNSGNFDEWSFDGQLGDSAAFEDGYEND